MSQHHHLVPNEGFADRWLRLFLAPLFLLLWPVWWSYLLAAIFLLTGASGLCPLYGILGINTRGKMTVAIVWYYLLLFLWIVWTVAVLIVLYRSGWPF